VAGPQQAACHPQIAENLARYPWRDRISPAAIAKRLTPTSVTSAFPCNNDFVTCDGTPITAPSAKSLYGSYANSFRISQL
jgi:hypothetical protein